MKTRPVPITSTPILSASVGQNASQFAEILHLHVTPGSTIADLTYGKGWFWKQIDFRQYTVFGSDVSDRIINRQTSLLPSPILLKSDATQTPYRNASIDCVVIDPPYAQCSTAPRRDSISKGYNLHSLVGLPAIIDFYRTTAHEISRILKPNGIAIVKCQDCVNSGQQNWIHCEVKSIYESLPCYDNAPIASPITPFTPIDLFILVQDRTPIMRHPHQIHARKNHSYWWVFKKKLTK